MRTLHIAHYKTIAFAIHSVDPTRNQLSTIAFVIHSVDPTRNQPQRLVRSAHPTYSYKTIALVIHSVDPTRNQCAPYILKTIAFAIRLIHKTIALRYPLS